jgi:hypothetical protein
MRIAAMFAVLGLAAACSPVEMRSDVVASAAGGRRAVVRTTEDLAPGDVVHIWHWSCSSHPHHCRYVLAGDGIVAGVTIDAVDYAVVQLRDGTPIAVGDRAVKDSPMFYWHRDPPMN